MYFCNSILKYKLEVLLNLEVLYHDDIYLHSLVIGQSHPVSAVLQLPSVGCSAYSGLQWPAVACSAMFQIVITRPSNNEVTSCTFTRVYYCIGFKLNLKLRRRFNLSDVSQ